MGYFLFSQKAVCISPAHNALTSPWHRILAVEPIPLCVRSCLQKFVPSHVWMACRFLRNGFLNQNTLFLRQKTDSWSFLCNTESIRHWSSDTVFLRSPPKLGQHIWSETKQSWLRSLYHRSYSLPVSSNAIIPFPFVPIAIKPSERFGNFKRHLVKQAPRYLIRIKQSNHLFYRSLMRKLNFNGNCLSCCMIRFQNP